MSNYKRVGLVTSMVLALLVLAALEAYAAPPGLWPTKKGEVCWVADAAPDERSFVKVQVTNMGSDQYVFHGFAFLLPAGPLQPMDGNALVSGSDIVGMITKMEQRGNRLESYSGLMLFDLATVDGTVDGLITECETPPPATGPVCNVLNTGPIPLWYDDDCDPTTLPPEIIP